MAKDKSKKKKNKKGKQQSLAPAFERAALYAGSFNPVTKGHLHVIGHAAKMTDRLVVGVGSNPKKNPMFSGEERAEMIRRDIAENVQPELDAAGNDCTIEVVSYEGATTDLMHREGLSVFFRGIRGVSDFNEEDTLALANADLYNEGNFKTNLSEQFTQALVYTTDPELRKVSSSVARELCQLGKDDALLRFVSPEVRLQLIMRMDEQGLRPNSDLKYRVPNKDDFKKMETIWNDLTEFKGDPVIAREIFVDLMTRYAEPHRIYHNAGHLAELFSYWENYKDEFAEPEQIALAIFFHDVIYDVSANDNEQQSADYAAEKMKAMGFDKESINRVRALVEMTKTHECALEDNDASLFLDIDMAVLGTEPKEYRRYSRAIAAEYGHHFNEREFAQGRLQLFLSPAVERDHHFITRDFESKLGKRAQRNLLCEKQDLESELSRRNNPSAFKP